MTKKTSNAGVNLVLTVKIPYKACPQWYPKGASVGKIIAIDLESFRVDLYAIAEAFEDKEFTVSIERADSP